MPSRNGDTSSGAGIGVQSTTLTLATRIAVLNALSFLVLAILFIPLWFLLPMARCIMDLHGGSISLTSEPGAGTSATFRFPPAAKNLI